MIDRDDRIKPCGSAVPPLLIEDFHMPDGRIFAKVNTARMISPTQCQVDIPVENGFVSMVDREHFDAFQRDRALKAGAVCLTGTFLRIDRSGDETRVVYRDQSSGDEVKLETKLIIGTDVARSNVAKAKAAGSDKIPYVIAYHEIIEAPEKAQCYDPLCCDVIYDGVVSPDFYGWVFPHGKSVSVGMGTGIDGVDLKKPPQGCARPRASPIAKPSGVRVRLLRCARWIVGAMAAMVCWLSMRRASWQRRRAKAFIAPCREPCGRKCLSEFRAHQRLAVGAQIVHART